MRARDLPGSDQMKNANHPLKRHPLKRHLLNNDVLHSSQLLNPRTRPSNN